MNIARTCLIRRIAWSLAIGAVMTVLVAWLVLLISIDANQAQSKWLDPRPWPIAVPADWPGEVELVRRTSNGTITFLYFAHGQIGWQDRIKVDPRATRFTVQYGGYGWPSRALATFVAGRQDKAGMVWMDLGTWRSGLAMPTTWHDFRGYPLSPFPLFPLWKGFAINTLFYGLIVFAATTSTATLKRRRRVRRGLCIHCAYPIVGLVTCPECGHPVAAPSHAIELPQA